MYYLESLLNVRQELPARLQVSLLDSKTDSEWKLIEPY